jgi:hypothetical protein
MSDSAEVISVFRDSDMVTLISFFHFFFLNDSNNPIDRDIALPRNNIS